MCDKIKRKFGKMERKKRRKEKVIYTVFITGTIAALTKKIFFFFLNHTLTKRPCRQHTVTWISDTHYLTILCYQILIFP